MDNLLVNLSNGNANVTTYLLMLLTAFTGGFLASISPCSIAMLPLIAGYVGGCSKETPFRTFIQMWFFVLGTAVVFTVIGVICAVTGSVFASVLGGYFTLIMASLLLIIGFKITGVMDFEFPVIIKSMPQNSTNSLVFYPFLIGIAFALAGTPCSTPILAGIMVFAAMGKNIYIAIAMLFLFSVGQGIILILAGTFASGIKKVQHFAKYSDYIIKASGLLLIVVALYLYYKVFSPLI